MSKKTFKAILATVLSVVLVVCLGVSAFAAGNNDSDYECEGCPECQGMNGCPFGFDNYRDYFNDFDFSDYYDYFDFDDYYDFDGFNLFGNGFFDDYNMMDIDEIIDGIEDKEMRAEIQKLYDDYLEASEKADTAWDALEKALDNIKPATKEEPEIEPEHPAKPEKPEKPEEKESEFSMDDEELFKEFLSWYKENTVNA